MKKSFFFISCEEAHHICDKSQYGEATLWEKIKLNIRLTYCQVTRADTKKKRALTRAMRDSNIHALNDRELIELKQQVNDALGRQR